jgi:hypothetical protein
MAAVSFLSSDCSSVSWVDSRMLSASYVGGWHWATVSAEEPLVATHGVIAQLLVFQVL